MNTKKYCPTCNYAREATQRNVSNGQRCPMCDISDLGDFYSVGSVTHRKILSGEIHQPPYALNAPTL